MADVVEVLVPGGKANPGPPLGPALGPLGINIKKVVDEINNKTKDYNGMTVPVKVIVDASRNFTVEVGTPPTSALVLSELKLEKGSGTPNTNFIGSLTIEQAIKVAQMKRDAMLSYTLKNAVKEVAGTCVSLGVMIEGKKPKEFIAEVNAGKYDDKLSE
ncbi:50S ribosomal protein L11 [Methanocella arvoryzae]|uniref:Large ribosomal subunit protein uL11 n=1 Tax=Methanocella arvoryzae (strain DSM 22066 / NBRC 105507 / MRE50) TaxID=351160 RepID=RL11_METAR|nr:50S ribosomal protein L11 [Methanocella arvoryzae]Q0W049.1 RecName: Full=Large ribosomal subunit protein uL11; AltName: Full=50S ribosomal protein L11 [Methanocella arvoryzae MRE50]CAJ38244.1 50S ribosomal protein L11P [Methanocella arvoryzae MRE50]